MSSRLIKSLKKLGAKCTESGTEVQGDNIDGVVECIAEHFIGGGSSGGTTFEEVAFTISTETMTKLAVSFSTDVNGVYLLKIPPVQSAVGSVVGIAKIFMPPWQSSLTESGNSYYETVDIMDMDGNGTTQTLTLHIRDIDEYAESETTRAQELATVKSNLRIYRII